MTESQEEGLEMPRHDRANEKLPWAKSGVFAHGVLTAQEIRST
jgi:hypothetical protein